MIAGVGALVVKCCGDYPAVQSVLPYGYNSLLGRRSVIIHALPNVTLHSDSRQQSKPKKHDGKW